jgi:NADPH:quinone reductase-like Zn-dependent oxidoreductase
MRAVRFAEYGGVEVLNVIEVPTPEPAAGQALVQVKAAGINPGEAKIREGLLDALWPATFPSGQGSDLAGVVAKTGPGVVGVKVGDEVIGYTDDRASQAEYVLADVKNLTPKPAGVSWEVAGSLHVVGATAYAAVRAVTLADGDTVVVAGATGGVGVLTVQLAKLAGATVIGIAGPANSGWLTDHGVVALPYGAGLPDLIRAETTRVDAFVDTIVNFDAVAEYGVKAEGNAAGASAAVLAELAALIAGGRLEVPIEATFPLSGVREAYQRLAQGHVLGKIVLVP